MANKKRLSDMLRQEVTKSPDVDKEAVIDVTADAVVTETVTGEELPTNSTELNPVLQSDPNPAKLEKTIAELKASLDQAAGKEASLQQEILDLQSELTQQKELGQKLQKELDKTQKMKEELEEVKKDSLQLAQSNSQLIQEIDALQKEIKTLKEAHQKSEPRFAYFPNQKTDDPSDFAAKTWLLD